jgi:hypothetical protein
MTMPMVATMPEKSERINFDCEPSSRENMNLAKGQMDWERKKVTII